MKIGLCLSGGGIKGAAHIGVLKAFEEENIKIDCISGTSSGSIVASMYAMGYSPNEIYKLFKTYGKQVSKVSIFNIFKLIFGILFNGKVIIEGMNNGNSLYKLIQEQAYKKNINRILDVNMPLIIPSVNLKNGEIYLFTSLRDNRQYSDKYIIDNKIEIGKAVQASCSYPGIFCPVDYNGQKLIDGGIRENIPWKQLKQIGADKIISISFESKKENETQINMLDCIVDSINILTHELYNYEVYGIEYLLKIKTKHISLLDIEKIDEMYNKGYTQTKNQINKIKEYLYKK